MSSASSDTSTTQDPFSSPVWKHLDSFDKQISRPIFAARLPFKVLEFILSIPGNFFGCFSFTVMTFPALVSIYYDDNVIHSFNEYQWYFFLVASLSIFNLLVWVLILSPRKNSLHRFARWIFYGPVVIGLSPIIGTLLLYHAPCSYKARQIGYFQICAKLVGVIPTAILKPYVKRHRPAAWVLHTDSDLFLQKAAREKHYFVLTKLFSLDAFQSMPSGDAAGAIACMYSLLFSQEEQPIHIIIFAWTCVLLSCIGRVYWLAHHVGDVFMGVITSLSACWVLEQTLCTNGTCHDIDHFTPLIVHGILLAIVILTRYLNKRDVFNDGTIKVETKKKK